MRPEFKDLLAQALRRALPRAGRRPAEVLPGGADTSENSSEAPPIGVAGTMQREGTFPAPKGGIPP